MGFSIKSTVLDSTLWQELDVFEMFVQFSDQEVHFTPTY